MSLRELVRFVVAMETDARDWRSWGFSFSRLKGWDLLGFDDLDFAYREGVVDPGPVASIVVVVPKPRRELLLFPLFRGELLLLGEL